MPASSLAPLAVTPTSLPGKENGVRRLIGLYHVALAIVPGCRWQAGNGHRPALRRHGQHAPLRSLPSDAGTLPAGGGCLSQRAMTAAGLRASIERMQK